MRLPRGLAALGLLIASAVWAAPAALPAEQAPLVYSVTVDDVIHPITALFIKESIDTANKAGAALLIIKLNTPGGLMDSMESIISAMTASKVPIVVYVNGTKAASAGFFLTIAADVAVMAPGTRIGAAHPVLSSGELPKDSPMMAKLENDASAYARTLATNRGRNAKASEEAVRKSSSFTEQEALRLHLIDYICRDESEILKDLDGKTIRRFDGSSTTLHLRYARIVPLDMSARERFLSMIANPFIASILLLVGVMALYVEFTHPGMIAPGLIGGICLLLFALSIPVLPVNWIGIGLVALGVVMFVLEIKVPSYGFLTLGGIACLVVGSLILFKSSPDLPGMQAARWLIVAIAVAVGVVMAILTTLVARSLRRRPTTGASGLIAEVGTATTDLDPEGRVFVHGEYWNARSAAPIRKGSRVRVMAVRDLLIEVEEVR